MHSLGWTNRGPEDDDELEDDGAFNDDDLEEELDDDLEEELEGDFEDDDDDAGDD